MLPSQGLFRSIPCPFFLAGLCERPHCSFRHCRSDIRIDRKLESESLDETTPTEETLKSKDKSNKNSTSTNHETQLISIKEPVNAEITISSSSSSKSENNNTKELQPERLNSTQKSQVQNSTVVEPSRKRSRDSDSKDSSKRRKVSADNSDMGIIVSKVKGVVASAANSCSSKSETSSSSSSSNSGKKKDRDKTDDIDKLVEEIERSGKSSSDAHHKRRSQKHRHKHSKNKDGGDGTGSVEVSTKEASSGGNTSSSHRKENRSKDDHHHKKSSDERKDKDRKDSKKDQSKGSDHHKRRKDSNDSVSSSNSPKDHKRIRKSSSCNEPDEGKRHDKRHHSSEHSKKKESSSSSTPKKDDVKISKSSNEKTSELIKDTLKSVQQNNSIDTTNRFNVLAESSADESAYNSDVFDESFDFKYPGGSDSEDDPEMVARECLELFENYKPDVQENSADDSRTEGIKEEDLDEGFSIVGKKRVAHSNAIMKAPMPPAAPKQPPMTSKNLQDTLLKRFDEQSKSKINVQNGISINISNIASSSSTPTSPKPSGKMRIAHVPNAGQLAKKPVILPNSKVGSSNTGHGSIPGQPGSLTYSQTVAKGVKREAHRPSSNVMSKPGPVIFKDAINKSTKIPHVTRQQIMDKMFAEYCRLIDDHEQAFQMTVSRENELIGKCSSKQVYYSSGISIISGLRKSSKQENDNHYGSNRMVSHEYILSGSLDAKNCSVRTVKKDGSLPTGNTLYRALRKYVMTEQQLIDNGYPRPHPSGEPGRAMAKPRPGEENSMNLTNRICDRCKKRYMTTEDGDHIVTEVCNYHWGRKYNQASRAGRGARETTYICCGSDDDKIGCVTSICHVSKCPVPISSQKGFVEAVLEEGPEEKMGEDPWDMIGIDCEMVYTTHGNELARVTIVGVDRKVLYDEIVKTTHRVLDCNSRFSGITFDDMDKAKRTITEIQAIILTHLRPNTIIIGHSLESDLIALRLKHECVIDTTVLYPHRMGPPKKRALKTLSVEILKKVIQESDSGHDSAEDAQIAVELVMAKLKFDSTK